VAEPRKLGLGRNVQLQSEGLIKIVQHLTFTEREVRLWRTILDSALSLERLAMHALMPESSVVLESRINSVRT
jgi:hypothetical protein